MSLFGLFNLGRRNAPPDFTQRSEIVQTQSPLRRVLAFAGCTIDDVVNDPIARRKVQGYYKLHRWVGRESKISDLERQWGGM